MGVAQYVSGPKALCNIHHPSHVLRMENEFDLTMGIGWPLFVHLASCMCQASFSYFPFKVREYKIEVVCMLGRAEFIFVEGHTLEKEETESARGNTQSNISGKWNGRLGWQASLHLMCQACSRCWGG